MTISPDAVLIWEWGPVSINGTLVFTWLVMLLLFLMAWLATRRLSTGPRISFWQNLLETVINVIRDQIAEVTRQQPDRYLPFLGTLLLFISLANFLSFVPGYHPPTGSLSTTTALALCVFFAVPYFGITRQGFGGYLKHYIRPTFIMLPFNIIGELSRTLALSVRLFGNIMSGPLIGAVLLSVAPLFLPVIMHAFELLIGQIQAFIFAILATVYIASATEAAQEKENRVQEGEKKHE